MYKLTLSLAERQAIDWVGDRYSNGHDLYCLLFMESSQIPEVDWDYDGDITFIIPENIAWQIQAIGDQDNNLWPCFAREFAAKMRAFVDSIV